MSKGNRNERRVAELYEQAGGESYRPENSQYGTNDLWNLFDLGVIHPPYLYLVQVKSNQSTGVTQWFADTEPFRAVPGVMTHFVVVHDGQGGHNPEPPACRLGVAHDGSYEWAVDERGVDCDFGERVVERLRNY